MIIALILIDADTQSGGPDTGHLDALTRTILRGPFGLTLVAARSAQIATAQAQLSGYAIQIVDVASSAPHALLIEGLAHARQARARWEKARAAAVSRFGEDAEPQRTDQPEARRGAGDWSKLQQSPDVKLRGLARSFQRDGVMLIRADTPALSLELQAQIVEAFAREGSRVPSARPITQTVRGGMRDYPVLLGLEVAQEVEALPPATDFDEWLLANLARIHDVNV